jgi:hypothetical protein
MTVTSPAITLQFRDHGKVMEPYTQALDLHLSRYASDAAGLAAATPIRAKAYDPKKLTRPIGLGLTWASCKVTVTWLVPIRRGGELRIVHLRSCRDIPAGTARCGDAALRGLESIQGIRHDDGPVC